MGKREIGKFGIGVGLLAVLAYLVNQFAPMPYAAGTSKLLAVILLAVAILGIGVGSSLYFD